MQKAKCCAGPRSLIFAHRPFVIRMLDSYLLMTGPRQFQHSNVLQLRLFRRWHRRACRPQKWPPVRPSLRNGLALLASLALCRASRQPHTNLVQDLKSRFLTRSSALQDQTLYRGSALTVVYKRTALKWTPAARQKQSDARTSASWSN